METAAGDRARLKKDFTTVGCLDKAIPRMRHDPEDPPDIVWPEISDVAAMLAKMDLEPSPGRRKGFTQRHERILVRLIPRMGPIDDDVNAGHDEIDACRPESPSATVSMGL